MVSQNGIKYAVHIVSTNFGDLVAVESSLLPRFVPLEFFSCHVKFSGSLQKVCECLLRRGPLTYQNIARFTKISPPQVMNCLLLLIQHNCVQAFSLEPAGDVADLSKPINTEYIALFDNIIHRTRFSKFIAVVSQELDKECVDLFEGLLQHGRLSLKKIIDRAKSGPGDCAVEDTIRENLAKLLDSRFVERCPAGEAVLSPPAEEGTVARKRGAKSSKIVAKSITIEERILDAAAPMEAKRFLFTTDSDSNKTSENPSEVLNGEKRKYDSLESERETSADDGHVPWRVNFEEFLHRFRCKACVENVRERLDDGAAIALSAMLEATRSMEKKVKSDKTVPLSINTIYEEVMKKEAGRSMTLDHLRASLALLGCERGSEDLYTIDTKAIIKHAQTEEVESIVLKRYGRDAYRIFRLLMKTGRLQETDKISGTAFVDKKETPKILYRLWKDEFLYMEKATVTTTRQLQFLLWKVNRSTLWPHLLDEMYHTALNLCQRVAYELERENEILNLPPHKRVGPLEERFTRLRNVGLLLDASLMQLDDALMLFHDF